MKIVAGFDCAVSNLGICYVQFNDKWKEESDKYIVELDKLYDSISDYSKEDFINTSTSLIKKINTLLDNIVKIIYFNVIDLVPGSKANKVSIIDRTKRLKHVLYCLDQQLLTPDIVLIEYQMKQNDISRAVSHQILYHYIDMETDILIECGDHQCKSKVKKSVGKLNIQQPHILSNSITYAIDSYPLLPILPDKNIRPEIVEVVGTTLKNAYHIAPGGEYANFIVNYSNYVANKKHTDYNFKYFVKVFGNDKYDELLSISNKTNDIADAFMMIFNWLKKKELV